MSSSQLFEAASKIAAVPEIAVAKYSYARR